jgi:hypothetical protein
VIRDETGRNIFRGYVMMVLAVASCAGAGEGGTREAYALVENFSAALPSSEEVRCEVDQEKPKVGLGAARVVYRLPQARGQARLWLEPETRRLPGPGTLKLWIKGDGSGNQMQLCIRHGKAVTDARGHRRHDDAKDEWLEAVKLDFEDWRELSFELRKLPEDRAIWWQGMMFSAAPGVKEPKLDGTVLLDDMRLLPLKPKGSVALVAGLLGQKMRVADVGTRVFLDVRNFTNRPAAFRAHLAVTDRNDSPVVERNFDVKIGAGEEKETALDLAPENLSVFLPPFRIVGDVLSPDMPDVSARIEEVLVLANSRFLFETFSDVRGGWLTAGYQERVAGAPHAPDWNRLRNFTVGETYRFSPFTQTSVSLSREALSQEQLGGHGGPPHPTGPYALRVDYDGDGAVFNFRNERDRYLPGNAFRAGFWVRGDKSGAALSVIVHDYSDMADFWPGGWKRVEDEKTLCVLDSDEWRYVEIDLPGGGVGSNTRRGSSDGIDFPLEIAAFRIDTPKKSGNKPPAGQDKPAVTRGTFYLGPITVWTQQRLAETLSVAVGYDDPNHEYVPAAGATATVQNAWPGGERTVNANWVLLDRARDVVAKGQQTLVLPPTEARSFRIELAPHAAAMAKAAGPLTLSVSAADTKDAAVTAEKQIVLSKPDSHVKLATFEVDRGYLATKAYGIAGTPPVGSAAAQTSTEQAHGGLRSLAVPWDKEKAERFIAVDPPIPGIATSVSMWVHGDGSGVLFYPLIGDRRGVNKGATHGQWDFFLPRVVPASLPAGAEAGTTGPNLQNVVCVDWKGWRQLKFLLPIIPPTWSEELPVRSFVPSYPLGLNVAINAATASGSSGTIFVDDIEVETHVPKESRLNLALEESGDSNVLLPGSDAAVWVSNYDRQEAKAVRVRGGAFDWRGARVGGAGLSDSAEIKVPPGDCVRVVIGKALPAGMYSVRCELLEGETVRAKLDEDVLVANLSTLLGEEWKGALADPWKLRKPLDDLAAPIDEEWDWVEYYPGNIQTDSALQRVRAVRKNGGEPMLLLGYSAYWAGGVGFEQRTANAFVRRQRDVGHAVDTFMVPERVQDWDHYVCELMRALTGTEAGATGAEVAGWTVWDNPDGSGPLGMKPERLAPLLERADRWRRVYCPNTPLLIGGMNRETAVPYIERLAALGALEHLTGVNVRLDVGSLSPEDAQVLRYTRRLKAALKGTAEKPKSIYFTDLDWAVEKDPKGIGGFDQAAYLVRSALLMAGQGLQPALSIANEDTERLGLGLAWRRGRHCPPLLEKPSTYLFKPGWWGIVNTRRWLRQSKFAAEIEIADETPGRTRCCLFQKEGVPVAAVWRNDDFGELSFAHTGLDVVSAEDLLGSTVPPAGEWYAIGKVPAMFVLKENGEPAAEALARLWVRDGKESTWPQRVLAAFDVGRAPSPLSPPPPARRPAPPGEGNRSDGRGGPSYRQTGGVQAEFSGQTVDGDEKKCAGLRFAPGGTESFTVSVPSGSGLVLRKGWFLDESGHSAEVKVNGKPAGTWDLRHSEKELSGGMRSATFLIPKAMLAGEKATVELTYPQGGNTTRWTILEYRGGAFPLTALEPIHANQNVGHPRTSRNIVGAKLKVGEETYALGLGCFAQSLIEYPLGGQFKRFTATVGVDAAAEGRGSVVFEVHGDGKKLWNSPLMSGLDAPKKVDVPVAGVRRLRLVVTDGGDGNRFDAADWCEARLDVEE